MNFQVGDTIQIESPGGAERGVFFSHIVKVRGNEIGIAVFPGFESVVAQNELESLQFTIIKHDAIYEFTGQIGYRGYSYFFVGVPVTVNRKQRRYEVRIPAKFPVEVLYSYRESTPVAAYLTNAIDLSAGGIKIQTPIQYLSHTILRLIIYLPENDASFFSALVIRSGPLERPEPGNLYSDWTALNFQQITEQQRKKIRKFIYRWQELRVKSLI